MIRRFYAALFALLFLLLQPALSLAADDDISRLYNFTSGTTIQSSQVNGEFNQLISTMNGKMSRAGVNTISGANTFSGNNTFSGENTFSNATAPIKTDKILEYTGAAGVTIDSVRLKDSMVKVSGTPTEAGEIGYGSNVLKYHNGSTVIDVGTVVSAVTAKSGAYTAAAADDKAVHTQSGTYTVSLTAAATLGSKWYLDVRNIGTGIITFDPNGAETIDGASSLKMYQGESYRIVCDGSNFVTIGRQRSGLILITSQTASGSTTIDFTTGISSDFDHYVIDIIDYKPATDATNLQMRVSTDTGSSYKSDGAYNYSTFGASNSSSSSVATSTQTQFQINANAVGNASSETSQFTIDMFTPSATGHHKFNWKGTGARANAGEAEPTIGGGYYTGVTNAIDAIRFLSSSGNITSGTFRLYGVR